MPELPEVETIRRDLERDILNKIIQSIHIPDGRVLREPSAAFVRRLKGQTIKAINRRGKALLLTLSSGEHWVVQVMMTGQLVFNQAVSKHTRVYFEFNDGTILLYNDQRVFGQMRVVKDPDEIKYFRILGPEPFVHAFNDDYIAQYLKSTARPIKNVLLDHTFVAGVGNIYACEILFRCKITPERIAQKIRSSEIPLLRQETIAVLNEAIKARGSSMRNYVDGAGKKGTFNKLIRVYAREGEACLVCAKPIARMVQSGRSTFYCMKCQK